MKAITGDGSNPSYGQKALWYLNQFEPASTAYHLGLCLRLTGSLDEHALASAWAEVVMAHPQLRARFMLRSDRPAAVIDPLPATLRIQTGDSADVPEAWKGVANRSFALDREAPVRALLLRDGDGPAHLLLCLHHVAGDLWSSAIILRELSAAYHAHLSGHAPATAREQTAYTEFAAEERRWVEGPNGRAAWNFWREYLNGLDTKPLFGSRGGAPNGGQVRIALDSSAALLVEKIAREQGTTPYPILLATYARLLSEETGRDEITIGTPASIRRHTAFRDTVGYLVNAVPLRCRVRSENGDWIGAMATNVRRVLEHRRFPFAALVEGFGGPREPGSSPIFQTMFAYQSLPRTDRVLLPLALGLGGVRWNFGGGITAENVAMPPFDPQFPLALTLCRGEEGFFGSLQYDGRRVSAEDATRLAKRFPQLVQELPGSDKARAPGIALDRLERLEDLFDSTARRTPNAIAVRERARELTYAQVKTRADTLAAQFNAVLGDKAGAIAVQMPSCAEAAILLLAILKSGRAFFPIDPTEPRARRNAALRATRACALVTPTGVDPGVLAEGVMALTPEQLKTLPLSAPCLAGLSRTAYLVFTSGTTGQPKAVEIGHAAVINHARSAARIFALTSRDRVLQFHTLAFDAAFEEIFPTWATGATIIFEPRSRELNAQAFLETIRTLAVTALNLPTSYWHALTAELVQTSLPITATLRLLVVGGEQASWTDYHAWKRLAPLCRWINTYGPSEATITALTYEPAANAAERGVLPIGRPIDGVTTLVLNEEGEEITCGEGELLLGGKGLAIGYYGEPGVTAEKFVMRAVAGGMERFYRTGDRVRLRRDGNAEYVGRIDRQLKIRGYRVAPEEIEMALRAQPGVADAFVTAEDLQGELHLTAWIVRTDRKPTEHQVRANLSGLLPPHMVPSRLAFIRRLPRKPSGKVDTSALPGRKISPASRQTNSPHELAVLFSELLGHPVRPADDFFLSGGHSLLALQLLSRIEARYGVRISVNDFFATPTAAGLWKQLKPSSFRETGFIKEPVPVATPVSSQQRRALLAHEIGRPALGNITLLLRIDGCLETTVLSQAVQSIARQNPLLSCGFLKTHQGVVLCETPTGPSLEERVLPDRGSERDLVDLAQREASRAFALDGSHPWFRLLLVSREASSSHLLIITHHAVVDGWAFESLLEDLSVEYRRIQQGHHGSPPAGQDYRSFALAQARWLQSPAARKQVAFWKRHLNGAEETQFPFRRPTPDKSWKVERREIILSRPLSNKFRQAARAYGTTPFVLAMASFNAILHRYAGQREILMGTVVLNRTSKAEQLIRGPLQNPIMLRTRVTSGLPMRSLARRTAQSLLAAQKNGALPLDQIMRGTGRPFPLHGGIQFLSGDRTIRTLPLGSASLRVVELPTEESPFELSVSVSTATPRLKITFEFHPTVYPSSGINHLARQYAVLLGSVATTPRAKVGELNMIPADEKRTLERRISTTHLPRPGLLHEGFASQVRGNPDAPAIVSAGRRLTYGELEALSDRTADTLVAGGLKPGGLVAVMLEKGWEQVVACLAILKAGGTYVPMDPGLPAARLKAILGQGQFHGAITSGDTRPEIVSRAHGMPPFITILSRAPSGFRRRPIRIKPESLAYIIFTSGTSGVPKGVMISHQAAVTTLREINRRFQLSPNDRMLAVSSLGFDLSVFDIFGTLGAGGTIVMPESNDPREWARLIRAEGVTTWNSVPCLFGLLLDEAAAQKALLKAIRLILLSGDFVSPALAHRIRQAMPHSRLISLGGATEAAIWSIAHEVEPSDPGARSIPYGRALRGQGMFVLDSALNHCATGVTGELFIAGAALAEGYWRDPAKTKSRFLLHPRHRVRLYRTGDQGRYLENGEIEILGRLDAQVKVNGIRIERAEIEAALCSMPSVRQAAVEVRADSAGNKSLIAFVAGAPGTSAAAMSAHLRRILPAAMIPSTCVVLDRLPLTTNGKIDRAALGAKHMRQLGKVAAVVNATERSIAEIWSTLLGGVTCGVEDDFFALGGHSLLAIQMLQQVRSRFATDLPISLVLDHPTIRGMAAAVDASVGHAAKSGLPVRATAEFEKDSKARISVRSPRTPQGPRSVLLTGATGHLGSSLLIELLKNTSDRVYCLVRARSNQEAQARLAGVLHPHIDRRDLARRVVAVAADLSREQFGLDPSTMGALTLNLRAAYHCAAEVNFIASYEKLVATNVDAVRELISLVTAGGAVLHHVSSVAVFPYGGQRIVREDDDIAAVTKLMGGYAQSKWASEQMIRNAIPQGLRAVIYRPAQIVGRRLSNQPRDLLHHLLHACATLRTVPDIKTTMDIIPLDYAASAIRCLSGQESSLGKVFHLVHPQPVSLREFVALFPSPLPLIPVDTWLAQLDREARRSTDASLHLLSMLAHGLDRADLIPPVFDCSNTTAALRGTGIACPPLDGEFVRRALAPPETRPPVPLVDTQSGFATRQAGDFFVRQIPAGA
jgi:amino acid adenylation domain-containing protein/thioester reductase-like protein